MIHQSNTVPVLAFVRKGLFSSLLLAMTLLIASCDDAQDSANDASCKDDITLKDVTLERVDGVKEDLSTYLGKVVVVNVWATWCAPCRFEMASLQALSDRLDPEKAVVLGVSIDRKPEVGVQKFLDETNVTFKNFIDPKQDVMRRKWKVSSLPETFIFDGTGCLKERIVGMQEWDSDEIFESLMAYTDTDQK